MMVTTTRSSIKVKHAHCGLRIGDLLQPTRVGAQVLPCDGIGARFFLLPSMTPSMLQIVGRCKSKGLRRSAFLLEFSAWS